MPPRGQKYATVGLKEGTTVVAWMTKDKRAMCKKLAAKKKLTLSAMINKLLSIELAKADLDDESFSFEL